MDKILIVDDMREVYEVLQRKFRESDYASTVEDALRKISERNYTKIITDYHLGEDSPKGGLEILRSASKKGIESILMSTENHKEEALKLGAKFIFKKELFK